MKISSIGAKLFHAGGRTYRHDEANSRLPQICESTKKNAFKIWVNNSAHNGKQILVALWRGIKWQIRFARRSSISNISGLYLGGYF
jgi:hypothetical protein